MRCNTTADALFGPVVNCSDIDFTLAFEQSVLVVGISSLFLLLFPFRLKKLYHASVKTLASPIHTVKTVRTIIIGEALKYKANLVQGVSILVMILQLVCLSLWIKTPITKYSIVAGVLSVISITAIVLLMALEYKKTARPSSLTSIYLLVAIIADLITLRTIILRGYSSYLTGVLSGIIVGKLALLVLESWSKKKYLKPTETEYGPEETMGILGSVFWWLNSFFLNGNKHLLSSKDLFPLDQELHSGQLLDKIKDSWEKSKQINHTKSNFPFVC
jgi:hypothetical protein